MEEIDIKKEKTTKQSDDNIELRNEDVQEILGRPPKWIVRWGILVISIVIFTLFIGSIFFIYPDVISSEVTITTEHPAVWVTARGTGKIQKLFVSDNQKVEEGDLLAVIENPTKYDDVQKLESYLSSLKSFFTTYDTHQLKLPEKDFQLGELQSSYSPFYSNLHDYIHFCAQQYHQKKITAYQQELNSQIINKQLLENQQKLQEENLTLQQKQFDRDVEGYKIKAIALFEYEASQKQLLSSKQAFEQAKLSTSNAEINIDKLKQTIIELELDYADKMKTYQTTLKTNYDVLVAGIAGWKHQYLLRSTTPGIITFTKIWSQNQHVNAGDKVFGIVAEQQGNIIGKIQLPSSGAGKVKTGQQVNIKLDGYPYMEYGMLPAKVFSISLVPDEKLYTVQLSLPKDMETFYSQRIDFTGELTGIAEIITEEQSLFQRMFSPLKYFFKKNM